MANINVHYEAAFEDYLRARGWPYVSVNEARKTVFAGTSIKSFDFLVYSDTGPNLIIDVKGRQFPDMIPGRAKRGLKTWENWITREDVDGLGEWWGVFGPGFWPVLVFAYWLRGDPTHSPFEDVHFFKNRCYAFTAVGLEQYVHAAKPRSMKWRTIAVPSGQFSNLVKQVSQFM